LAETLCPISSGRFFPSNHDVKEKDMKTMFDGIKRFIREEDGAAGVEYALLLTLVAIVIIAVGAGFNGSVTALFNNVGNALQAAATAAG